MKPLEYKNGILRLLDQRKLPKELVYVECKTYQDVAKAISDMVVRGAPLIGITGAYGALMGASSIKAKSTDDFLDKLHEICEFISSARPTAISLYNAVISVHTCAFYRREKSITEILDSLFELVKNMCEKDKSTNRSIAKYGNTLINEFSTILTYCNTGSLATYDYGTALGVIRAAHESNKNIEVIACETRPYLQGSRLTAWELKQENIPFKLICDNMAGHFMRLGKIDCVIVGADRIASNGDTANKIGTYTLAVLAHENKIPFYVAAPFETIDFDLDNGDEITIEERDSKEITHIKNLPIAPEGINVLNPAFDITPNRFISAFITEKGVIVPPFDEKLRKLI